MRGCFPAPIGSLLIDMHFGQKGVSENEKNSYGDNGVLYDGSCGGLCMPVGGPGGCPGNSPREEDCDETVEGSTGSRR